jgi:hypothetical protein
MTDTVICPICGKDYYWSDCKHYDYNIVAAVNEARYWARKMYRRALLAERALPQKGNLIGELLQRRAEVAELRRDQDSLVQGLAGQMELVTELRSEIARLQAIVDRVEALNQTSSEMTRNMLGLPPYSPSEDDCQK